MRMIRTIHPVGQGAFYTETFEDDVIVYDCGSKSGKEFLHREIDTLKGKTVKALFISHFHADHINGIEYLLSICKVEYIFVPFLSNELKIYYACLAEEGFFRDFVIDSQKAIDSMPEKQGNPKVIYVSSESNDSEDENAFDLNNDNNVVINSIPSGTSITYRNHISIWEYIPYNLPNAELEEKVRKACEMEGIKNIDKIESSEWDKIETIFKGEISDKNSFSMVLYSGSCSCVYVDEICCNYYKSSGEPEEKKLYVSRFEPFGNMRNGCLYTGDCKLENEMYSKILEKYAKKIDNIHVFQVPHHGSKYNFNSEVFNDFKKSEIFFMSVGLKNGHRHPNKAVLLDILNAGKILRCVNEKEETKFSIVYYIYK